MGGYLPWHWHSFAVDKPPLVDATVYVMYPMPVCKGHCRALFVSAKFAKSPTGRQLPFVGTSVDSLGPAFRAIVPNAAGAWRHLHRVRGTLARNGAVHGSGPRLPSARSGAPMPPMGLLLSFSEMHSPYLESGAFLWHSGGDHCRFSLAPTVPNIGQAMTSECTTQTRAFK